ncbi:hypothetical protein [Oceanobacillus sp. Castelsardo]|uniref:hypothetical protein n=1 Tax=Oceanobacillus sp. Castelsardo TaxID=1851204 RepID=UPI0012E822DE|nr:hypothetical protein [Oceanobacillus sp. Castelsardo]
MNQLKTTLSIDIKEIRETIQKSQELVEFAESKGWSEEELAKVINLLHSYFEQSVSI